MLVAGMPLCVEPFPVALHPDQLRTRVPDALTPRYRRVFQRGDQN